jgi:hypothetical protein
MRKGGGTSPRMSTPFNKDRDGEFVHQHLHIPLL